MLQRYDATISVYLQNKIKRRTLNELNLKINDINNKRDLILLFIFRYFGIFKEFYLEATRIFRKIKKFTNVNSVVLL